MQGGTPPGGVPAPFVWTEVYSIGPLRHAGIFSARDLWPSVQEIACLKNQRRPSLSIILLAGGINKQNLWILHHFFLLLLIQFISWKKLFIFSASLQYSQFSFSSQRAVLVPLLQLFSWRVIICCL